MEKHLATKIKFGFILGIFVGLSACQASAPAPVAETVGTLTSGPSTWTAPVHETTPPPSETYAVRARRERQAAKSTVVDAPTVEEKVAHGF